MKKKCLLIALLCSLSLVGCGTASSTTDAPAADSKTETPVENTEQSTKDFVGDSYSDTGDGVFLVVTAGGNSESGNVPVVYAAADTSLLQIGYETTGMNGGSLSYIYIDGMLLTKEQLSDSQGSLDLSGDTLTTGTHKVEVVQYENDVTDGAVTVYKTASYEIKEK